MNANTRKHRNIISCMGLFLVMSMTTGCNIGLTGTFLDDISRYIQLRLEKVGKARTVRVDGSTGTKVVLCQGSSYVVPLPDQEIANNQLPLQNPIASAAKKDDGIELKGIKTGDSSIGIRIRSKGEQGWRILPIQMTVISCQTTVELCKGEQKSIDLPSQTIIKGETKVTDTAVIELAKENQSTPGLTLQGNEAGTSEVQVQLQSSPDAQPQTFRLKVRVKSCSGA